MYYNIDILTTVILLLGGLPQLGDARLRHGRSPASKRGQDKRFFCRSAAIYHNYDIIMA